MCRELSGIQRLTPARTLPGPDPSKGKTCIAACPSACRDYFLISPKLHIQAVHRAYLAHRLPASLPTPHMWLCMVSQPQVTSCSISAQVPHSSTQTI